MQCPICKEVLLEQIDNNQNKVLKCHANHSFDISKYGYVNLLVSKTNSGDNQMFLAATVVSLLPTILIFLFAQKYFVKGITNSGLK